MRSECPELADSDRHCGSERPSSALLDCPDRSVEIYFIPHRQDELRFAHQRKQHEFDRQTRRRHRQRLLKQLWLPVSRAQRNTHVSENCTVRYGGLTGNNAPRNSLAAGQILAALTSRDDQYRSALQAEEAARGCTKDAHKNPLLV